MGQDKPRAVNRWLTGHLLLSNQLMNLRLDKIYLNVRNQSKSSNRTTSCLNVYLHLNLVISRGPNNIYPKPGRACRSHGPFPEANVARIKAQPLADDRFRLVSWIFLKFKCFNGSFRTPVRFSELRSVFPFALAVPEPLSLVQSLSPISHTA